jgi:RNAse (barnase) inhibitor barstar
MAYFDQEDLGLPDWHIFQNGWVVLYWRQEILSADINRLAARGYKVFQFDGEGWTAPADALSDLGRTLSFPHYYGQNLDAFNDCLGDIDVPMDGGVVLVFRHYDRFAARHRDAAQAILDICADNARRFMLFGQRLATLVQSDDPKLSFAPVGSTPVLWNRREQLDKTRGV